MEEALRPRAQVDWLDKVTMLACSCPCALSALTPMVLVPQAEHPAVVRFIGRVGKKRGLYVGLELLDYSEGLPEAVRCSSLQVGDCCRPDLACDVGQEVDGVRYFECTEGGHAVFVRPKQVRSHCSFAELRALL